jgi:hypothetical protein
VLARVDRAVRLVARIGLSVSIRVHRKAICFVIMPKLVALNSNTAVRASVNHLTFERSRSGTSQAFAHLLGADAAREE